MFRGVLQRVMEVTKENILYNSKWLQFKQYEWRNQQNQEGTWDLVARTTPTTSSLTKSPSTTSFVPFHQVDILATISNKENTSVVLTRQFRLPLKSYCIEFPSGLVDKGETAEETALRELKEETGYEGKVVSVSHGLAVESGITNTCTSLVHIKIDENTKPSEQSLQDEEDIEVIVVPQNSLLQKLRENNVIDSKVYTYAYALQFTQ